MCLPKEFFLAHGHFFWAIKMCNVPPAAGAVPRTPKNRGLQISITRKVYVTIGKLRNVNHDYVIIYDELVSRIFLLKLQIMFLKLFFFEYYYLRCGPSPYSRSSVMMIIPFRKFECLFLYIFPILWLP